jgi:hypothetical protein
MGGWSLIMIGLHRRQSFHEATVRPPTQLQNLGTRVTSNASAARVLITTKSVPRSPNSRAKMLTSTHLNRRQRKSRLLFLLGNMLNLKI